jgi:hypothetical protein
MKRSMKRWIFIGLTLGCMGAMMTGSQKVEANETFPPPPSSTCTSPANCGVIRNDEPCTISCDASKTASCGCECTKRSVLGICTEERAYCRCD